MKKNLLTQEGYDQLSSELSVLKDKQNHLITQIEEVAQPDESGEDGLATQLKEELEVVNDKIDNIEEALEMAQIITDTPGKKTIVQVGSVVKIRLSGKQEKEFSIVSHMESDPTQNKISDKSPLGLALIGRKINEEFEVDAPVGKITYKVVSIN
jgi:transcription elongation factor GreA